MEPNTGATAFWIALLANKLPSNDPAKLAQSYRIPEAWVRFWMQTQG